MARVKTPKVQLTTADKAARKRAKKAAKAAARAKRVKAKAEAKAKRESVKAGNLAREAERQADAEAARKAKADAARKADAEAREGFVRRITSRERDFVIRLVFKRGNASLFVTRTGEMSDVAEARVSRKMREEATKTTGRTASGDLAPLTFAEAWRAAQNVGRKVGATTVTLGTGERFALGTRERVA
jgi:membrane protein involved in colicin uptake